ncbi:helicase [Coemansia interrupta]|uniref:RNA helicase n=1 Tax=Coemansia interrupta TaxID=1126814 RepID=A0A9W8HPP9_9FUNG|nr:helicase [Coemansia interrupta]
MAGGGGGKKSKAAAAAAAPSASSSGKGSKKDQGKQGKAAGEAAQADVVPAKAKLFGGWTGKTPMTLLNELVQRQSGWHRASYNVHGGADGKFTCTIRLTKPDPKTRSAVQTVTFRPPSELTAAQPSAVEAKHYAATYALFRMRSDTRMHLSLPPEHRAYWEALDGQREKGEGVYAADPFAAKIERDKGRVAREREREKHAERRERAEQGHREELLKPAARRRWDEMLEVRMAERHRLRVEGVVRTWTTQWGLGGSDDDGDEKEQSEGAVDALVKLGFQRAHAEEALGHGRTRDGAVDWLCVHVPEDDLPARFMKRGEAPVVVRLDGAGERAQRRLGACGFPRALVQDALGAALEQPDADEDAAEARAASALVRRLCGHAASEGGAADDGESVRALADEAESLRMIFYGEEERVESVGTRSLSVALRPSGLRAADAEAFGGDLRLDVWVAPGMAYPERDAPVLALSCGGGGAMAAYLRLGATQMLNRVRTCDGLPVVFEAVRLVEEQLAAWISSPPPLGTLMRGLVGPHDEQPAEAQPPRQQQQQPRAAGRARRRLQTPAQRDVDRLADAFAQLQTDAAYGAMQATRRALPAHALRDRIVQLVGASRCTVVTGATGCGKTTQVPQFLLDAALAQRRHAHIVCTQPRRISAIGVAQRVSDERAEPSLGAGLVGYAVRGDSRQAADTRLLFCTTGVLLRMLHDDAALRGVTHVICDEVHERSVDSDVLLALLRQALERNGALRVVLMSATAQSDVFAAYFGGAPAVDIPGRTFPVQDVFVEDLVRAAGAEHVFGAALVGRARARLAHARSSADAAEKDAAWLRRVAELTAAGCDDAQAAGMALWDERFGGAANAAAVDVAVAAAAVRHIDRTADAGRAVLVFMPGVAEIRACIDALLVDGGGASLAPMALHAGLAAAEQRRVFARPSDGRRKVVVATNIAETSITIDDIGFVVDCGRVRETVRDAASGISRLATRFCSHAAATQRRGRAGRVAAGTCIRVYTRATLRQAMPEHGEPEILRVPLEQTCLQVKALGHDDSGVFMARMLSAPASEAVARAERLLALMGACPAPRAPLSALGRMLAAVPADLRLAKLLVYAAAFGVLARALPLAALMASDRGLFHAAHGDRQALRAERLRFAASDAPGDWLADLRAYEHVAAGRTPALQHVSRVAVREVKAHVRTLREALSLVGLTASAASDGGDDAVLRALVFAGLSPSIVRVRVPPQRYHEVIGGGAVGVDREARELAFYRADAFGAPASWLTHDVRSDLRVFVHPQSTMFDHAAYRVPFVTCFAMSAGGGGGGGGKVFMRDVTVPGVYAMLMFGPPLVVDREHRVVALGDTGAVAVRAWPRVAVLVNHLRRLLDELLRRKLDDPALPIAGHPVVDAVLELIRTDGH